MKLTPAERSVSACRDFLEGIGFTVSGVRPQEANGHDLVAIRDGEGVTIEVKTASKSTRSWRVGKLCSPSSDYVAIVLPNGAIHFDTMSDHRELCSKDGSRRVTGIVKLLGGAK